MSVRGNLLRAVVGAAVLFGMANIPALAQSSVTTQSRSEIEKVLKMQQEAWNRKDLDAFMGAIGTRRT
jgi:hypothetical protein